MLRCLFKKKFRFFLCLFNYGIYTVFYLLVTSAFVVADYEQGVLAFENNEYELALKEFRVMAEQGDGDSQDMLGLMYLLGVGVEVDHVLAFKWFSLAAEQDVDHAVEIVEKLELDMTPVQLKVGKRLVDAWKVKQYIESTK